MTLSLGRVMLCAVVAGVVALPVAASAEDERPGFYASLAGAYVIPTEPTLSTTVSGVTASAKVEMDSGFGFMAAVGYAFGGGLRTEFELGYRTSSFAKLKGFRVRGNGVDASLGGAVPFKGDVKTLSLMANGVFAAQVWQVRPYAGLGLGMARHSASYDEQTYTVDGADFTLPKASDDDWVFAYQALAGVAYPLSDGAEVRAGYRYFATSEAKFGDLDATYGTHNFEAGILFRF